MRPDAKASRQYQGIWMAVSFSMHHGNTVNQACCALCSSCLLHGGLICVLELGGTQRASSPGRSSVQIVRKERSTSAYCRVGAIHYDASSWSLVGGMLQGAESCQVPDLSTSSKRIQHHS